MKKLLLIAAIAAAVAVPAIACDGSDGFTCSNECPLAQQANLVGCETLALLRHDQTLL